MKRPLPALALETAAWVFATGFSGTATAQAVLTHPNERLAVSAEASAAPGPATRAVPVGQAWMLERIEPESPAASANPAARTSAVAAQRSSNLRAVTTPRGAWMLEDPNAAAAPLSAAPDLSRFTVRSTANGPQVLELKTASTPPAATARAASPAAGFKVVEIRRSELATKWPIETAAMTMYRVVD